MSSRARNLANLLGGGEVTIPATKIADIPASKLSDEISTIEQVSDVAALTATGNAVGDQRVVGNNLYIWNGTGWYRIALINETPTWDSGGQPEATYSLNTDSPAVPTIITLNATDPDGLPIQYSHITGGQMDSIATISQDSSVFTITPKSASQAPNGGTGSVTFRASDGVNILPYVSSFTLQFAYDWSASTQTADLSYVGGTQHEDQVETGADYGWDVTISRDGLKAVIGARNKDWTQQSGVSNNAGERGAVYTWTRPDKSSSWTQHYPIQNSSNDRRDHFGNQVALSGDGNYLAVGAHQEGGSTIDTNHGAVYIFTPNGNSWTEVAHIYPSSRYTNGKFGEVLDIDDDGDTMIVGAPYENPGSTANYGALYFYSRSGSTWTMDLKTNPYSSSIQNRYGYSVSIAGDGLTAAVGIPFDDTGGAQKGAVHVYTRSGSTWTLSHTLQGSNTVSTDRFGTSVDISRDGLTIAAGCGGDDTSNTDSGSVYVFKWSGSAWVEESHLVASDENTNAYSDPWTGGLGYTQNSVSLSDDGDVLFAGARYWRHHDGGTTWRNGQGYIFQRDGSTWTESKRFSSITGNVDGEFGYSAELSGDGGSVVVGAQNNSTVWLWEA